MLKVGLTGGLACGKTFVGEALAGLGLPADPGRRTGPPGAGARRRGVRRRGAPNSAREILTPTARSTGARWPRSVFGAPERLARLNGLVHPPVVRREEELIAAYAAREPHGIAVVEAAILIETGSYKRFDRMILVACAEEQQVERAMRRDGARRGRCAGAPRAARCRSRRNGKFADFVIDTSGEKEDTLRADPRGLRSVTENRIMRTPRPFLWAVVLVAGFLYVTSTGALESRPAAAQPLADSRLWTEPASAAHRPYTADEQNNIDIYKRAPRGHRQHHLAWSTAQDWFFQVYPRGGHRLGLHHQAGRRDPHQ